jgi:hypothetical protein
MTISAYHIDRINRLDKQIPVNQDESLTLKVLLDQPDKINKHPEDGSYDAHIKDPIENFM